jgi:adenosylmethionine-8-amino-7-oxononanoate aminotransferase
MIGLELIDDEGELLGVAQTNAIKASLKQQGVLVGQMSHVLQAPESILFLAPPLILTEQEAQRIVDAFAVALQA